MIPEAHPEDLLGAYAVDACAPAEAAAVADHANGCARCAAEIERLTVAAYWLGATHAQPPAPALRGRVLAAALAARPARGADVGDLLDPYVAQVSAFDGLLGALSAPEWEAPTGPHPTVREMVGHLARNDQLVLADLGLAGPAAAAGGVSTVEVRRRWRDQAHALIREVAVSRGGALERDVRLAGPAAPRRPLREALTQRAFETWIHADDIRAVLDLPGEPPPAPEIASIVDFGLRLLPGAMDAAGRAHPGRAARLVLTGPGGGDRLVALSATHPPAPGTAGAAEVSLPAERFCRLMARRVPVDAIGARVSGDAAAATDLLAVAATMGCD
jgi:uncharacterized protein (TIGR03083 family)